jgi:hypothetical protein
LPALVVQYRPYWHFSNPTDFGRIGLEESTAVVINLRRTNLVRMSYSKFRHDGNIFDFIPPLLHPDNGLGGSSDTDNVRRASVGASPACNILAKNSREPLIFTLDQLLCGVWHYGIGDQEFASAAAIRAAQAIGRRPFVVLYEDLVENEALVKTQLFTDHLSMPSLAVEGGEESGPQKVHTADTLCRFDDVTCVEPHTTMANASSTGKAGIQGLTAEQYPCLYKQFHGGERVVWSVPLLGDGTISLFGDCHPLRPLHASGGGPRKLHELYA